MAAERQRDSLPAPVLIGRLRLHRGRQGMRRSPAHGLDSRATRHCVNAAPSAGPLNFAGLNPRVSCKASA